MEVTTMKLGNRFIPPDSRNGNSEIIWKIRHLRTPKIESPATWNLSHLGASRSGISMTYGGHFSEGTAKGSING